MIGEEPHYGKAVIRGIVFGFVLFMVRLVARGEQTTANVPEQILILGLFIAVTLTVSCGAELVRSKAIQRMAHRNRNERNKLST
jgi:hypothetical protein